MLNIKFGIVIFFIESGLIFNIECCVWSYSKEAESLWSDDSLIDMIEDNYTVVVPQMEGGWKVSKFLICDDELGLKIQILYSFQILAFIYFLLLDVFNTWIGLIAVWVQ